MTGKVDSSMSYIFDALKKLEQKRHREGVSRLLMVTGGVAPERKKWPIWPIPVLSALLLLNAGIMIWWVRPWTPPEKLTPTQPPAVDEKRVSEVPATTPQRAEEQERPSDAKEIARPKAASEPASPAVRKEAPNVSRTERAPATRSTSPEPQVRSARPLAPDGRVLGLKELPPAIRSGLPEFKISALYYTSEPHSRFTKINEQTLREGQVLAPDLKLEEITPEGVILSHKGYRFQVGISENR